VSPAPSPARSRWLIGFNKGKFTLDTQHLNIAGRRILVEVERDRLAIYGNSEGLRSIANWLNFIAGSDPKDMFHFHLDLHIQDPFGMPLDAPGANVPSVVIINRLDEDDQAGQDAGLPPEDGVPLGYDVQFMHLSADKIDQAIRESGAGVESD